MTVTSFAVVRVADLQPDFQGAVVAAFGPEGFDIGALKRAVAHEFDFLGPWVDVAVEEQRARAEDSVLRITFSAPDRDLKAAESAFGKATRRAERGEVSGARDDLRKLVADHPEVPKYWRALGQAYLVMEEWDDCEDALLKALALDALDPDSLTLLGNLYAKRGKPDRALALYRQSLQRDRNVHALTNAAGLMAKSGAMDDAVEMFREATQLDPKYPNAWYGLGLALAQKRDEALLPESLGSLDRALETAGERQRAPQVWDASRGMISQLAAIAAESMRDEAASVVEDLMDRIDEAGDPPFRVETTELQGILAKIELSWVHRRGFHRVLVNPSAGVERYHQVRHEIEHARLSTAARKAGVNRWFTTDAQTTEVSSRAVASDLSRLERSGCPREQVAGLGRLWVEGLNSQLYNAPIDLFIETTILRDHPHLRELWFYALERQLRTTLRLLEDKQLAATTARIVFRSSMAMNGATALWFEEHFPRRTDILERFKRADVFATSKRLYGVWQEGAKAWKPGEELDWVDEWARALGVAGWYRWIDGNGF